MTLCPVAAVARCQPCLMFKICPGKGLIGDYEAETADPRPAAGSPREP